MTQIINDLDILPMGAEGSVSKIRASAATFDNLDQSLARNVPNLLQWAIVCCGRQRDVLAHGQFGGNEGTRRQMSERLAQSAKDLMMYAGMLKYKMPVSFAEVDTCLLIRLLTLFRRIFMTCWRGQGLRTKGVSWNMVKRIIQARALVGDFHEAQAYRMRSFGWGVLGDCCISRKAKVPRCHHGGNTTSHEAFCALSNLFYVILYFPWGSDSMAYFFHRTSSMAGYCFRIPWMMRLLIHSPLTHGSLKGIWRAYLHLHLQSYLLIYCFPASYNRSSTRGGLGVISPLQS